MEIMAITEIMAAMVSMDTTIMAVTMIITGRTTLMAVTMLTERTTLMAGMTPVTIRKKTIRPTPKTA
jgi:hypothetical protein